MSGELRAWCNDYDVVAASSEEEAREVLRGTGMYVEDEEALDGEGWGTLRNEDLVRDEGGIPTGQTVGDVVKEAGKPAYLWSCAQ